MVKNTDQTYMKTQPVLRLLLTMALPMVVSMLVNSLYNIVDSFFVAKISEDAMTALSLVYPMQNLINAVMIRFGVGINAVISFYLGAQNQEKADRAATQGVILSTIHGILLMVFCLLTIHPFLKLFTLSPSRKVYRIERHSGLSTDLGLSTACSCWFSSMTPMLPLRDGVMT